MIVEEMFAYRKHSVWNMQIIETTDPKEARRCRYAQYRRQKATLTLMGSTITGLVQSVMEDRSFSPTRWIVTVAVTTT
jgi:hypothetical protein